ncbi:MAG: PepSY-associated TM helix domain-containing protein [Opitutaceae bacterium]|nr:PepSY-associated TM helix domain-containing protein [Opitutaceae bacterium]
MLNSNWISRRTIRRDALYSYHSWLGIISGSIMILIGLSGSIAVFNDEIEWLTTPEIRADPSKGSVSIDRVVEGVRSISEESPFQLVFPASEYWAYTAIVDTDSTNLNVLISPETGRVTKVTSREGYSWSLPFWIRQFHVRLLLGLWGRVLVGIFGVTLILSCITGILVNRNWIKSMFQVRRNKKPRVFYMDLHKLIGIWSLLFNLMIGFTGAFLGLENLYNQIQQKWIAPYAETAVRTPQETSRENLVVGATSLQRLPPSELISKAQSHFPRMNITRVSFPRLDPTQNENAGAVIIRGDHPGALIATGQSRVRIHPYSGDVLEAGDARQAKVSTLLYNTLDPLHHGYLGKGFSTSIKYSVKILWALLGITPGLLAITGSIMWWLRRKQRALTKPSTDEKLLEQPTANTAASGLIQQPQPWRHALAGSMPFLALGYIAQATVWRQGWLMDLSMLQHWLIKPISLMALCFPVTIWLYRYPNEPTGPITDSKNNPWKVSRNGVLLGLWYLFLVCLLN